MKELVIFDLDGTLLNTIADLGEATNYALEACKMPTHPLGAYNRMVGGGVRRLIERALPAEACMPDVVDHVLDVFKGYYDEHLYVHTTVYPGINELLHQLTERGRRLAVSSNKYQAATERLVRHFFGDLPWAAVFGNMDGVPTKPDPSVVFEVLAASPTRKDHVLYCGDSGVDMETARRACVDSCGVTWGFRSRTELERAGADHIVTEPSQILALV